MAKFLLLCFLFTTCIFANTSVDINGKHSYESFEVQYLKDETSKSTIEDIAKSDFEKRIKSNFNLGYNKGSIWFKFTLENNSNNDTFILSLNESFYEIANLYYYDKKWIKKSNSIFTLIKDREVKSNHLAFDIKLPKNEKRTYFLELKGKYAYFGNLVLYEKSYFHLKNSFGINILYTFSLGIILALILFTLFLYTKTKEKIYFYYMAYCFFNFIYFANIGGLLVYIDLQKYIYELQLAPAFMIGFLTLFSNEYLETGKYLKSFNKIVKFLSVPFFIFGLLVVYSYQPWNKFINNFSGLIGISLIILSIVIYFKGNRKTIVYTFAMILYFTSIFMFSFMVNGTLEYSDFTRNGFTVVNAIEMIIFSYILANRYNQIKEEMIITQKKLLAIKEGNQILLEKEVKKRTSQLQEGYNQIKKLLGEREMLLKEVHHRVKNNFHTIMGLLWFEGQKEEKDKQKFQSLRNRIRSMSMIHERLYKAEDISNIPIKEYLEDIINNLIASSNLKIELKSDIEDIFVEFEYALSLGVIVNEILSNSLKHNSDRDILNLDIKLFSKENKIILIIKDNGRGFDMQTPADGLGMNIIKSFTEKLPDRHYSFTVNNGVRFELSFKEGVKSEQ